MRKVLTQAELSVNKHVLGKAHQVKLAIACLLSGGHLLIEDMPGMGKTTLAHTLAAVFGLEHQRVQFTSDMLPADLLGVSIFDRDHGGFVYHKGPVFTQLLLADEINRATPKTQSALLEAMEERQVTHEGASYQLPQPHYVIATQNPLEQQGTFPLPESQLDRFLMRISLGYPSKDTELALLKQGGRFSAKPEVEAVLDAQGLRGMVKEVTQVSASDAVLGYVQRLLAFTRESALLSQGVSPRGGLALLNAAKAWAYLEKRDYILPDDVQAVASSVLAHRIKLRQPSMTDVQWIAHMLNEVDVLG